MWNNKSHSEQRVLLNARKIHSNKTVYIYAIKMWANITWANESAFTTVQKYSWLSIKWITVQQSIAYIATTKNGRPKKTVYKQITFHISPTRESYVVSIVNIFAKIITTYTIYRNATAHTTKDLLWVWYQQNHTCNSTRSLYMHYLYTHIDLT